MKIFELVKVFDVMDMPDDLISIVMTNQSNGSYIHYYINKGNKDEVVQWLLEHGAEENERVLVLISW